MCFSFVSDAAEQEAEGPDCEAGDYDNDEGLVGHLSPLFKYSQTLDMWPLDNTFDFFP